MCPIIYIYIYIYMLYLDYLGKTYNISSKNCKNILYRSIDGTTVENSDRIFAAQLDYKDNINIADKLNKNMNNYFTSDSSNGSWFPINSGVFISTILGNYSKYWYPPVIYRGNLEQGRVISFSYLRNDISGSVYGAQSSTGDPGSLFIIYDNTKEELVSRKKIFCAWPTDAYTGEDSMSPCPNIPLRGIGCLQGSVANDWKCEKLGQCGSSGPMDIHVYDCNDFKTFIYKNKWGIPDNIKKSIRMARRNEVLIKSWVYNPNGPTGNGIVKRADGSLKWDPRATNNISGWSDVSLLYQPENIPLLAFGITVYGKETAINYKTKYEQLLKTIQPLNKERKNNGGDSLPIVWLDLSGLDSKYYTNPFFINNF